MMDWQARIDNYVRETKYPRSLFIGEDGRVVGTWIMGNNYRVKSGYYGGYPAGYLKRIRALFPDKENVLHIFSGKVDANILQGKTVDLDPKMEPDFVDDAQSLESVPIEEFDLIRPIATQATATPIVLQSYRDIHSCLSVFRFDVFAGPFL